MMWLWTEQVIRPGRPLWELLLWTLSHQMGRVKTVAPVAEVGDMVASWDISPVVMRQSVAVVRTVIKPRQPRLTSYSKVLSGTGTGHYCICISGRCLSKKSLSIIVMVHPESMAVTLGVNLHFVRGIQPLTLSSLGSSSRMRSTAFASDQKCWEQMFEALLLVETRQDDVPRRPAYADMAANEDDGGSEDVVESQHDGRGFLALAIV